jgi:hypothetical protein
MLLSGYETLPGNNVGSILIARHVQLTDPFTEQFMVPGGSINFKNINNPLTDFIIANTPGGKDAVLNGVPPVVQECVLNWCVQKVNASYGNGGYTENILEQQQLNTNNVGNPWAFDPVKGPTYFPYFTLIEPGLTDGKVPLTFGVNNDTTRAIIQGMQDFTTASWAILNNATEKSVEVKYQWEFQHFGLLPIQYATKDVPWDTESIPDIMSGLATSLTNLIRQSNLNDTGSIATVAGAAYSSEVHVELRLQWAALPGGLLLFSLVFLLSTVWRSSDSDKVGIWKTSALAVLFNGIGDDIQDTLGSKVKTGDARKRAKEMLVQLDEE